MSFPFPVLLRSGSSMLLLERMPQPTDLITAHFRLQEARQRALARLGIVTVTDLLRHFPSRYETMEQVRRVAELQAGERATVYGTIANLKMRKAFRNKTPIAEGTLKDETGSIKVIWFHQPYIAKMLRDGAPVKISGKVSGREDKKYFSNPDSAEISSPPPAHPSSLFQDKATGELTPVYPERRGVSSKWFQYLIQKIFKSGILETLEDPIPERILARYHLPKLTTALVWIHAPRAAKDAAAARKRFAFEEVFLIQLAKEQARKRYEHSPSTAIAVDERGLNKFTARFPFALTSAQTRAIQAILTDFQKPHAMSRLLEGDVGSGKTAVAAATAYTVAVSYPKGQDFGNLQIAYMAPTEILAKQHFDSFIEYFKYLPINIALITGSGCKKFPSKVAADRATDISRAQLLKWVANGEIPILIGTHALIQKSVTFKHLAYVIIDEQHRFGTLQRSLLARKSGILPHLLSMTATPIPRTLALTIYGDLDLTLLDEMPTGRKPIKTDIVSPEGRESVYEKIRAELKNGRQAYVICPRIDEPDPTKELALEAKSVKAEAARLKKEVFPEYEVGILHSKISPKEKERVMQEFAAGAIHILVATSVVEVGVNVPNATSIIIEGAQRFGLAQLHQLRGRVLRSSHQAYCYAFTDSKSGASVPRLKAFQTAKNGFELAELDLKLRGAGQLMGDKQWGLSDIGMEAIQNLKMVVAARDEAQKLLAKDPSLQNHSALAARALKRSQELHFE